MGPGVFSPVTGADQDGRRARLVALAIIGNRLRVPVARCEAGGCSARYDDPAALGEADIRARAITAGWREDLTGLLTCPGCQRRAPWPGAFGPAAPAPARHSAPAAAQLAGSREGPALPSGYPAVPPAGQPVPPGSPPARAEPRATRPAPAAWAAAP